MADEKVHPRTFYLNETHELTRSEREGGGGQPNEAVVDWRAKSTRLAATLSDSRTTVGKSTDPLKDHHFFLVALPEQQVVKVSRSKTQPGERAETPDFGGKHSQVFRRLGLDLLQVNDQGIAAVHATRERLDQLISTAKLLPTSGRRERDRWVNFEAFAPIPVEFRIHRPWVLSLDEDRPADEADPILSQKNPIEYRGVAA